MKMASASAASCCALMPFTNSTTKFTSQSFFFFKTASTTNSRTTLRFRASATQDEADCNTEECAPDKEVGKVSMEWLAGEKTKVVGTFPPRSTSTRGWTGYVEKDTAGQTNIYSVEPVVYVAESAISSGTAGTSSSGAENTAAIAAFLGIISVAAASSIILQLGKVPAKIQSVEYSGPSLNYYINKFKSEEIIPVAPSPSLVEASAQMQQETPAQAQQETTPGDISTLTVDSVTEAEAPTSE